MLKKTVKGCAIVALAVSCGDDIKLVPAVVAGAAAKLDDKLQINIPKENEHSGGRCKIIGCGDNKYLGYEVDGNEIVSNATENCCWQTLSKKYNNGKALNFKDGINEGTALFNRNLRKDYFSSGMGAVVGSPPQIKKDIMVLRNKLDASGLPMPSITDDPQVKVVYSLFSMQGKFENEFKEDRYTVGGKRFKFITPEPSNGSRMQVISIYDNRCDELGKSKCKCKTSDNFDEKIANHNKNNCLILKNKLNENPSWIKLLKFKDTGSKGTNYLCFVAYGLKDIAEVVEKVQKGYSKYKQNNNYYPWLHGEFIFPQLAFKAQGLENAFMEGRIFDKNSGSLNLDIVTKWVSDVLIQLDTKGVIAKAQTVMDGVTCCNPGNPITKCEIDCIATKIDKKRPCYLCICHESPSGEIVFDLGVKVVNLDRFAPAA